MALAILFVMLSITAYKRSFSTLFQIIGEHKVLSNNVEQLNQKAKNTNGLIKEVAFLDKLIGKEGVAKQEVQQEIVSHATNQGHVSISDLQPIHMANDNNYSISTNQIDVTGSVNELLQLAYNYERNFNLSRLVSMNFYTTKKNNKTEVLHLKMIFQNYENNK